MFLRIKTKLLVDCFESLLNANANWHLRLNTGSNDKEYVNSKCINFQIINMLKPQYLIFLRYTMV